MLIWLIYGLIFKNFITSLLKSTIYSTWWAFQISGSILNKGMHLKSVLLCDHHNSDTVLDTGYYTVVIFNFICIKEIISVFEDFPERIQVNPCKKCFQSQNVKQSVVCNVKPITSFLCFYIQKKKCNNLRDQNVCTPLDPLFALFLARYWSNWYK